MWKNCAQSAQFLWPKFSRKSRKFRTVRRFGKIGKIFDFANFHHFFKNFIFEKMTFLSRDQSQILKNLRLVNKNATCFACSIFENWAVPAQFSAKKLKFFFAFLAPKGAKAPLGENRKNLVFLRLGRRFFRRCFASPTWGRIFALFKKTQKYAYSGVYDTAVRGLGEFRKNCVFAKFRTQRRSALCPKFKGGKWDLRV